MKNTLKLFLVAIAIFATNSILSAQDIKYNGKTFYSQEIYHKNDIVDIFGTPSKYYTSYPNEEIESELSEYYTYNNMVIEFNNNGFLAGYSLSSSNYTVIIGDIPIKVGDNISILYKIPAFSQVLTPDKNVLMFIFNPTVNSFIFEVSADRIMSISYFIPD